MLAYVEVNIWAVLLATASSMVLGVIWYAKGVFGATWQKLVKLDDKQMKEGSAKAIIITVVASFITAYILAHLAFIVHMFFGDSFFKDSLLTAFWLWFGLSAARFIAHDAFERRPLQLTLMNISYEFVTLMVMGAIIGWLQPAVGVL